MIGAIKRHPVAFGIGAVVLVGAFLLFSGGGSETVQTAPGMDPNVVAAGTALQAAQVQANAQVAAANLAFQDKAAERAANLEIAKLGFAHETNNNTLLAGLEEKRITAEKETTTLVSTLAATMRGKEIDATVQMTKIGADERFKTQKAMTDALIKINEGQQKTQQAAIKKQCSGFFDCLF